MSGHFRNLAMYFLGEIQSNQFQGAFCIIIFRVFAKFDQSLSPQIPPNNGTSVKKNKKSCLTLQDDLGVCLVGSTLLVLAIFISLSLEPGEGNQQICFHDFEAAFPWIFYPLVSPVFQSANMRGY